MQPSDFDDRAVDIASERENYGFDNYADLIRRALYDAYIAGHQIPSDFRGDPAVPRTVNADSAPDLPDPSAVLRPPPERPTLEAASPLSFGVVVEAAYELHRELTSYVPSLPIDYKEARSVIERHIAKALAAPSSGIAVPQQEKCADCGEAIRGINWRSRIGEGPWRDLCGPCHRTALSKHMGTPTPILIRGSDKP